MVPDGVLRDGRRKQRGPRPFVAHPDCQVAQAKLKAELDAALRRSKRARSDA
tara:strand:- start:525 stop:680 length:156 start_codon:yes stop_codon:yes gene_type:complete